MLIAYWAAKGGSGATVLAAAHAVAVAQSRPTVLVDLDGDLPAALGVADPATGVGEWAAAGAAVPADAFERISVEVAPNLRLVGRGHGPLSVARAAVLAGLLSAMPRTVIVDCGTRPGAVAQTVARSADRSILVTRACYLALRRCQHSPLAPTEVALVRESQRALEPADLEAAIGAPIRLQVAVDPNVARAVDAGLLVSRPPRSLRRAFDPARSAPPVGDAGSVPTNRRWT